MLRTPHAVSLVSAALLLWGLDACAQGGGSRRDAGRNGTPDAFTVTLDAPFTTLDVGTTELPDAHVPPGTDAGPLPDAALAPPDAFVGTDAFVPGADAFVAPTDAGRDAGSGCSESPCRLLAPQCGCPGGQACYPSGTTRVCAVAGTRPEGSACTGVSDCAAGLGCVGFTPTVSMCSRICATDTDCGAGSLCIHTIGDGAGGTVPGLKFCSRACSPAPSAGCPAGLACTLFQETAAPMRVFTDCGGPVGTGTQFAPCTDESDCAAGYGCFDTGAGNECLAWCRVASPTCAGGLSCLGVAVVDGVEWGACD